MWNPTKDPRRLHSGADAVGRSQRPPAILPDRFRRFLLARFLATAAVQMQSVAVGWQIYARTGDPLALGLVGLAQFVPFLLLVLIAGQIADRVDRLRIVTAGFLVQMLCALLLAVFSGNHTGSLWMIFAILSLFGASRAFLVPATQATLIQLVPPERFRRALALNSSVFQIAVIGGPAVGGLIYGAGPDAVYRTVAVLLGLAALLSWTVGQNRVKAAETRASTRSSLLEGLHFVRSQPTILGAISLDLFAVLFGGVTALLPAYASDLLAVGPAGLGLLRTAPGVGATLAALALSRSPIGRHLGRWLFGSIILYGLATLVFGVSRDFGLSVGALIVMGGADMISVYIRHLLVQIQTPDAIRGRVSSVNAVFIGASNELGEFESGLTAAWFGLTPAVLLGGAATLLIAGLWLRVFPALRRLDRLPLHPPA